MLGDIANFNKGKGISKSDLTPHGQLACIRYAELYTHYGQIIKNVHSRTDVSPSELVLSEQHDVIIPSSGETKEDIATASCVIDRGIALGGDLNIIRSPLYGPFLSYYLSGSMRGEIGRIAQGHTVAHLYAKDLATLPIAVPSVGEQREIAACLSSLDALIAAEGRKLEALRAHKKGLMQQLFPREGKTQPQRRFPGFDGEWTERKIEDFANVTTGNRDTKDKIANGQFKFFVRSQNVERIDKYALEGPAVLTSGDGVGVGENFHFAEDKFNFHQRVYCIYDFEECVEPYFFFMYFAQHFKDRVKRMSAKNSVDSVRKPMVTDMKVSMPDRTEQTRIARFFKSLNSLSIATQECHEQLIVLKRGLLQQLFPTPDDLA